MKKGIFLVFGVMLLTASELCAEPVVSVSHQFYEIEGSTHEELREEMNRKGMSGKDGEIHYAYTTWNIHWNYQPLFDGVCSPVSVTVSVWITYNMPKWRNFSSGEESLRQEWARYLEALQSHEDGHRRIGMDAALAIEQAISTIGQFRDCDELQKAVNEVGQRVLENYRQVEIGYDLTTGHGRTQGAVFQ